MPTQLSADLLIEILTQEFGVRAEIDADAPFETLDFDSLVLIELAVILTQRYGIVVTDDELEQAGTINGTLQLLNNKNVRK